MAVGLQFSDYWARPGALCPELRSTLRNTSRHARGCQHAGRCGHGPFSPKRPAEHRGRPNTSAGSPFSHAPDRAFRDPASAACAQSGKPLPPPGVQEDRVPQY